MFGSGDNYQKIFMFSGFLDHGILQPTGLPHRDATGGDQGPQGLGPGQCHLPESGHQVNYSNVFLPVKARIRARKMVLTTKISFAVNL
jgi:hypothetical protein